jgi:hypothetical protein
MSGGVPVSNSDAYRAKNAASLRLQSLCTMPAEGDQEHESQLAFILSTMRFSKSKLAVCIQNPVRFVLVAFL